MNDQLGASISELHIQTIGAFFESHHATPPMDPDI
jgi:hypothetical protein